MISLLITLLIFALIAGLIWWALQQIPLPPPVRMVIVVVFVIILVLVLLEALPGIGGVGLHPLLR